MSDEQPFYAPGHTTPPPAPLVGEAVWTLRKDHHQFDCELYTRGTYGIEVQLRRDLELFAGVLFPTREIALIWAELERHAIEGSP